MTFMQVVFICDTRKLVPNKSNCASFIGIIKGSIFLLGRLKIQAWNVQQSVLSNPHNTHPSSNLWSLAISPQMRSTLSYLQQPNKHSESQLLCHTLWQPQWKIIVILCFQDCNHLTEKLRLLPAPRNTPTANERKMPVPICNRTWYSGCAPHVYEYPFTIQSIG